MPEVPAVAENPVNAAVDKVRTGVATVTVPLTVRLTASAPPLVCKMIPSNGPATVVDSNLTKIGRL